MISRHCILFQWHIIIELLYTILDVSRSIHRLSIEYNFRRTQTYNARDILDFGSQFSSSIFSLLFFGTIFLCSFSSSSSSSFLIHNFNDSTLLIQYFFFSLSLFLLYIVKSFILLFVPLFSLPYLLCHCRRHLNFFS